LIEVARIIPAGLPAFVFPSLLDLGDFLPFTARLVIATSFERDRPVFLFHPMT